VDPLVTSHDVVLLHGILAFIKSCFMGVSNNLMQIVLFECTKDSEKELPLRIVCRALVFAWQISSHDRISKSFCIEMLDRELFIFRDHQMSHLSLLKDFLLISHNGT
jgi:hypothetical protein